MSNNAATWPREWADWPGLYGQGIRSADLESYWVMDDRDNAEFTYFPFPQDSARRGLGLQVTCRGYQWNNALDQDFLIFLYHIKNVSPKTLNKVVVGIFCDPHIGGAGDFGDDYIGYIDQNGIDIPGGQTYPIKNMLYAYDKPGSSNDFSIPWEKLGWLGIKFLETPEKIEHNELGLTSVAAPIYGSADATPSLDENMWKMFRPGNLSSISQGNDIDNVLEAGSGYFSLSPGDSVTFAVAYILGTGLEDLVWNAQNADMAYARLKRETLPDVSVTAPQQNEILNDGNAAIRWTVSNYSVPLPTVDLYYTSSRGYGWKSIARNQPNSGNFLWDISSLTEGYNYRVAVVVQDSTAAAVGLSGYFIISNPQTDADPEILLQYPNRCAKLSNKVPIRWRAGDADGEALTLNIYSIVSG